MDEVSGRLRFDHPPIATSESRRDDGRAARSWMRRSAHSVYEPPADRDPIGILKTQNENRLPWLVPLRIERMLQNPFSFYRGTAALQSADLAGAPTTGAGVVLCGDAHISNFGLYASPQRSMVFDLNDFDEAAFGPWEWDVKRFVTSVVIAGRHKGLRRKEIRAAALTAVASYRDMLDEMLELNTLQRFYRAADVHMGTSRYGKKTQKVLNAAITASERRTSEHVLSKITKRADDGTVYIVEQPPTLTHLPTDLEKLVTGLVETYRKTVSPDIGFLLSQYTVTDAVRRVVGVGSVGTRCFIVVLTGPSGESLILQVKEAGHSVLNEFGKIPTVPSLSEGPDSFTRDHGFRVVSNQRILQAVSDPFLGYFTTNGLGFYVRQFRDRNISIDVDALGRRSFLDYADACGRLLARAHAQSPNAPFIAGYLGSSDVFNVAMAEWADAYADQSYADFVALREAVHSGDFIPPIVESEDAYLAETQSSRGSTATTARTARTARTAKTKRSATASTSTSSSTKSPVTATAIKQTSAGSGTKIPAGSSTKTSAATTRKTPAAAPKTTSVAATAAKKSDTQKPRTSRSTRASAASTGARTGASAPATTRGTSPKK
ncbi:DUF2252 family protein [Leifsonia sp. A12D58]|uniref:DUF2252 family protein n=1 Tax=Leifsonia sp. A12D58 TaxID=3397674 RepID=UPI0039DFF852